MSAKPNKIEKLCAIWSNACFPILRPSVVRMFIFLATARLFLVSKLNHTTVRGYNLQEGISDQIYQQGVRFVCCAASSAAEVHRRCP